MNYFKILILLFILHPSSSSFCQYDENYYPKNINFNIFDFREYQQESIDPDDVLKYIFPGNLYKIDWDENSSELISVWSCNKCNTLDFSDKIDRDNPIFPNKTNITSVLNKIFFYDDGKKFIYIFFNTRETALGEGRFSGGYLGVAVFRLENTFWTLKKFEPAIDCIGNWQHAPKPEEIMKIGEDKYGIYISTMGEGMAVEEGYNSYYGYTIIYSEINGKFQKVFHEAGVECKNIGKPFGTEWNSKLHILNDDLQNGYYKLKLVTQGNFDSRYYNEYGLSDLGIDKKLKKKKSFGFKTTRHYSFNGNEYVLYDKKVEIF